MLVKRRERWSVGARQAWTLEERKGRTRRPSDERVRRGGAALARRAREEDGASRSGLSGGRGSQRLAGGGKLSARGGRPALDQKGPAPQSWAARAESRQAAEVSSETGRGLASPRRRGSRQRQGGEEGACVVVPRSSTSKRAAPRCRSGPWRSQAGGPSQTRAGDSHLHLSVEASLPRRPVHLPLAASKLKRIGSSSSRFRRERGARSSGVAGRNVILRLAPCLVRPLGELDEGRVLRCEQAEEGSAEGFCS
jgi:hypothetical protein